MSIPIPRFTNSQSRPYFDTASRLNAPSLNASIGIAVGMVLSIAGTVLAGRMVAYMSLSFFVATIVYCAFCRPSLGLPIFIAYSAMEGMYKYTSGFSQVVYSIKPILEMTLFVGLLFINRSTGRRLASPPIASLAVLLAGWGLVEVFHPHGAGFVAGIAQVVVWYLAPMLFVWTAYNIVRSLQQVESLCYTLVAIAVVVSLFTFVQYVMGQSWTQEHLPGYKLINQGEWWIQDSKGRITDTSWRPASTSSIGGGGALWEMFGLIIGLGLLLSSRISKGRKAILLASIAINVLGIILSSTRLYLIDSMIVTFFMFVVIARSPRELARNLVMLLAVASVAGIGFTAAQKTSHGMITSRYATTLANPLEKYKTDRGGADGRAQMVLDTLQKWPFGIGYQRGTGIGVATTDRDNLINRDDEFNNMAADMGAPGLVILVLLIVGCLGQGWYALQRMKTQHNRSVGMIFFSLMLAYFISFFGGPALSGADMFWIFVALLLALPVLQRREIKSSMPAQPSAASAARMSL